MAVNTGVHSPPRNKLVSWLVTQALNTNILNRHYTRTPHTIHHQTLNFVEALEIPRPKKNKTKK
jgi:hypothetical protein